MQNGAGDELIACFLKQISSAERNLLVCAEGGIKNMQSVRIRGKSTVCIEEECFTALIHY